MKYEVTDKCEQARKTLTMPNLLIGSNEVEIAMCGLVKVKYL